LAQKWNRAVAAQFEALAGTRENRNMNHDATWHRCWSTPV